MAIEVEEEDVLDDGLAVPVTLDFSFAEGWPEGWVGSLPSKPPTAKEHAAKIPLREALLKQIKKDWKSAAKVPQTKAPQNWETLPDKESNLKFKMSRHAYRKKQLENNSKMFDEGTTEKPFVNRFTSILSDWSQQMREQRKPFFSIKQPDNVKLTIRHS